MAKTPERLPVKFLYPCTPYNAGERASLPASQAINLCYRRRSPDPETSEYCAEPIGWKLSRRGDVEMGEAAESEAEEDEELSAPIGSAATAVTTGAADEGMQGEPVGADSNSDESTHDMNAGEAVSYVASLETEDELDAVELGETAHPKYDGGRQSVMRAIAERREQISG